MVSGLRGILGSSFALTTVAIALQACGSSGDGSPFNDNNAVDGGSGDDGGTGPMFIGPGGGEGGVTTDGGGVPCTEGLCKQQQACSGSTTTTVSGTVYDPAGNTALYNVLVYVPNDPDKVAPIVHGASCDRCGSVSGNPLVSAITDTHGAFTLKNVPVGTDIPLIIQVGKWRRQLKIPSVTACVDNPLTDKTQTRLPKNQQEGDIPLIAVTTGGADSLECFLRGPKLGLDEKEFTVPGGGGSVNFFQAEGNPTAKYTTTAKDPDVVNAGQAFPQAEPFWSDVNQLAKYDMVLLSCEGSDTNSPRVDNKPQAALDAMYAYTSMGGRMFATHWHYYWFSGEAATNPAGVNWGNFGDPGLSDGVVNDSFPKGQTFRDWLVNTGASPTADHLTIDQPKHNVDSVSKDATSWITLANNTAYMTVNMPYGAADDKICGRAVFSDLHVGGAKINGKTDSPGPDWPNGCVTTGLSAQEKALEFLLFDLSSCVQPDSQPPAPPPPGVK